MAGRRSFLPLIHRVHIYTTPSQVQAFSDLNRSSGRTVAFVPTMGALHEGHCSLIEMARANADVTIVSSFVNPLQFDNAIDFEKYPSTALADENVCRLHGVDALYRPSEHVMYPEGFATSIHIHHLSDIFEGASRPGHFDGVATVVTKLLHAVRPDIAVFGAKDFQQVAVVKRLVRDLDLPVRLIVAPTKRESDGLAMSSRNVRLGVEGRREATRLNEGLREACTRFAQGTTRSSDLIDIVRSHCRSAMIVIDYIDIVDPDSLATVPYAREGDVIILAMVVGGVRLIDNMIIGSS